MAKKTKSKSTASPARKPAPTKKAAPKAAAKAAPKPKAAPAPAPAQPARSAPQAPAPPAAKNATMKKPSKKTALRDSILARKSALKPIAFSLDEVRAIAQTNAAKAP